MKRKSLLLVSVALAAFLAIGQVVLAAESDPSGTDVGKDKGMTQMMENANMGNMMEAMSTPEGKAMMKSCSEFMDSYGDEEGAEGQAEKTKYKVKNV